MTLFDSSAFEGHEGVHAFTDEKSGLKSIIAVHSTARGPAAGGCRMWPYADAEAALTDALRLSRAMSFKNAMADLDLGGGKAVIIGDARTAKSPALFEAFGACVEQLGGRYWTAEDVGVSPADLTHARQRTRYVAGLEGHKAASGDPSPVTAEGVFRGLQLCVRRALNRDLDGVRVAIQGVGHVGGYLAEKLHAAGAKLILTDVNAEVLHDVAKRTGAEVVAPGAIFDAECDVFAPCALGGAVTEPVIKGMRCRVIAGAANNQLADQSLAAVLAQAGILYVPDFVANCGGIIHVGAEPLGFGDAEVRARIEAAGERTRELLREAAEQRRTPLELALALAEARLRRRVTAPEPA